MSEHHPLKTLLNIHLASDASAASHLPFILNILSPEFFAPSTQLSKWTARIQALLHSKEPCGRWAGLILAQKTAISSQSLLVENGQAWTGIVLPLIFKNESTVILKAAIRLLRTIFFRLHKLSEFRRQVAVPNIPKLLAALIPLIDQTDDIELKVVSFKTLVVLIPLYPSLHKPSYSAISGLALRFLDGNPNILVSSELLVTASHLYSACHLTGGKVGASSLWRKTFDETLAFGTNAFWSLRTSFSVQAPVHVPVSQNEDPVVLVPRQLDRLNCAVTILDDLLGSTVYRPVQLPVGAAVRFALQLLRITNDPKKDGFIDPTIHILESSVIPRIQALGCFLIVSLAQRIASHLLPHLTRILSVLTIEIERQNITNELRHDLLRAIEVLLRHYPSPHSPLFATRLMNAVLPSVTKLLTSSEDLSDTEANTPAKGRKGKKKARVAEGDEIFSSTRPILCPTDIDKKSLLEALEVVRLMLRDPHLSTSMRSISVRVLIAVQMMIVRTPPLILSPDPVFYQDVLDRLRHISTEIASGTSSTLSKSIPLITAVHGRQSGGDVELQRQLELLLHPRLPPLKRSMPLAENLSLVFSEEPEGEAELRKSLGLFTVQEDTQPPLDVDMDESNNPAVSLVQDPKSINISASSGNVLPTVQPAPTQHLQSFGNTPVHDKQLAPLPQPSSAQPLDHLDEHLPTPFHPSEIEAPKTQLSQSTPKVSRMAASISTAVPPVYIPPANTEDDEDEEMPAIDVQSDSDLE